MDCAPNQYSLEGAATCTACDAGHVSNDGKTDCGKY